MFAPRSIPASVKRFLTIITNHCAIHDGSLLCRGDATVIRLIMRFSYLCKRYAISPDRKIELGRMEMRKSCKLRTASRLKVELGGMVTGDFNG